MSEEANGDGLTEAPHPVTLEAGLVEQLLGLSTGRTDGQFVPSEHALELLLAPAIGWAAKAVSDHGPGCAHPKSCPDVPPPLRVLLKLRPATVRTRRALLLTALIDYPDHPMTHWVRKKVLEAFAGVEGQQALVEAIESGAILTVDGLREVLGEDPQGSAQRLGSTLWARGRQSDAEQAFFDLLALVAHEPPEEGQVDPTSAAQAEPTRGERRREQRDLRARVAQLESEVRDLKRDRRKQTEALSRAQSRIETLRQERSEAQAALEQKEADAAKLTQDLRTARAELELANRELRSAAKAALSAREGAAEANAARKEIEHARGRAVRELSLRRREIEKLREQIAAIPSGKAAVHAFLEEEETRIDTDLSIVQGRDRERAEAEHALREKLEDAFRASYPEFVPPRPVLRAEPASLRLTALGGADEVGRSAYLLEIGDYSLLVDCGIKISGRDLDEIAPEIDMIDEPNAVVLTHAHTDHLGWLPALVHRFPDVQIYCTPQTAELVPIMLDDCQRHHFAMMHGIRELAAHNSNAPEIIDPYEPEDVQAVSDYCLVGLRYDEVENLPNSDLRLRFVRAGHILGAASVLIEGDGRRVLMGGDISTEAQLTTGPANWSEVGDVDLLVLESTYGGTNRAPLAEQQRKLVGFVSETLADGGSVILPCFALGRGQEVASLLARAMADGDLPQVTVWIDGMIRSINRVYEEHAGFSLPANFLEVAGRSDRFDVVEEARRQPTIIVTTSGMLAGGPAVEYARALLYDPRHRIAFTGYQDEGNPGYKIWELSRHDSARVVRVMDEEGEPMEIVAAAPAELFGLSAHADQTGLVENAALVDPKHVVLVHGEPEPQKALREQLYRSLPRAKVELGRLGTIAGA